MSGRHDDHLDEGVGCSGCHGSVVDNSQSIIAPQLHVDGNTAIQMDGGLTWNPGSRTCSNGSCHGENHNNESW